MESLVSDPATVAPQIDETEAELATTVDDYIDAKASLATLDAYIDHVHAVFGKPEQHVQLVAAPLKVTRLGVKVADDSSGPVNDLTLTELAIGTEFKAVIAIACVPRSELPPEASRLAQGERYL
jgi:hypothetical protein